MYWGWRHKVSVIKSLGIKHFPQEVLDKLLSLVKKKFGIYKKNYIKLQHKTKFQILLADDVIFCEILGNYVSNILTKCHVLPKSDFFNIVQMLTASCCRSEWRGEEVATVTYGQHPQSGIARNCQGCQVVRVTKLWQHYASCLLSQL